MSSLRKDNQVDGKVCRLLKLEPKNFEAEELFMDKTAREKVNTYFESQLWEEVSDEAADVCVGGITTQLESLSQSSALKTDIQNLWGSLFKPGDLKGYLQQIIRNSYIYGYYFKNS